MALVWDLSKAYNSIHTPEKEKFLRLIVWRSGKLEEKEKEENVEKTVSKRGMKRKTENEKRKAKNGKKANWFKLNVAAEEVDSNGQESQQPVLDESFNIWNQGGK